MAEFDINFGRAGFKVNNTDFRIVKRKGSSSGRASLWPEAEDPVDPTPNYPALIHLALVRISERLECLEMWSQIAAGEPTRIASSPAHPVIELTDPPIEEVSGILLGFDDDQASETE